MADYIGPAKPADITSKWLHDHVYNRLAKSLRVTLDSPFSPEGVFDEGEITIPNERKVLFVGGYSYDTGEAVGLTFNDDGRLRVDAEVTIQSVELDVNIDAEGGDTVGMYGYRDGIESEPRRVNTNNDGALRIVPGFSRDMVNEFSELALPSGENTVFTWTVPATGFFHLIKLGAEGDTEGVFRVKKNGVTKAKKRNTWMNRDVNFNYDYGMGLEQGDILEVTVEHQEQTDQTFSAWIYGEVVYDD